MKNDIEELKSDVNILNLENEKLMKQMEINDKTNVLTKQNEKEVQKKLKKRELECGALWDTLRDMYISGKNYFDVGHMHDLLAVRALDTKAKRKLKI
jgi:regulator of replication initiation timing